MHPKGDWKVSSSGKKIWVREIGAFGIHEVIPIAEIYSEAHADLVVAAVNACQKVNKDNPMAVAQAIEEMYEALLAIQRIVGCSLRATISYSTTLDTLQIAINQGAKAIEKAEGKEV